jgi:hypothetical protein
LPREATRCDRPDGSGYERQQARTGRRGLRRGPDDLITAGEVACIVYCPEQWRLQFGQGLPAENQAALDAGTRHHAGKAAVERVASRSVLLGQAILLAALLLLLLWEFSR